jgi:glutamate-1-semialdehyde aminotransferase/acyl carrier protein
MSRKDRLVEELRQFIEDGSGVDMAGADPTATYLELGLDSLFLTQMALSIQNKFGVKVTFRQLQEAFPTLARLAEHLDAAMPAEAAPVAVAGPAPTPAPVAPAASPALSVALPTDPVHSTGPAAPAGSIAWVIEQQLRLMSMQMDLLRGATLPSDAPVVSLPAPTATADAPAPPPVEARPAPAPREAAREAGEDEAAAAQKYDVKKAFGAIAKIHTANAALTPRMQARIDALIRRYTTRTRRSREHTQQYRAQHADPRVVSGFRPALKELCYPIVIERSKGSRLWDLDGNEYVDALNGFGSNFFGYQPEYITRAIRAQIDLGYDVGPQTPLAGECAALMCELTGFDRAAFCNTGSEAVMGCMRIARTVTGRRLIAVFSGSYHGIFDEVIVRGTKKLRSIPAAPGIMPSTVENVLVLDYGTPESLEVIRARAGELAAVLVEPIQSRRPEFQPKEFLEEVRRITEQSGTALIFDEVICGFRLHQGGAQAYFGIRADLASYGKVTGAGMSVGIIAGKRAWMDALDGGHWQFGDESGPTQGVTYFAGTFVRHPLVMAAVRAALTYLKEQGPGLQERLNARTAALIADLNAWCEKNEVPIAFKGMGSLWRATFTAEHPCQELLFPLMRDRGIHILEGFPCFLTLAHTDDDVEAIKRAFRESVLELQDGGFLPAPRARQPRAFDASSPPVPGARLGRDPAGNPAWFAPNPDQPGKYVKLETA